jgi:hypothetical protein
MNTRQFIHRGNQFYNNGFIKLKTMVSSKRAFVLHCRSSTESYEMDVVSCYSVYDFQYKTAAYLDETIIYSFMKPV